MCTFLISSRTQETSQCLHQYITFIKRHDSSFVDSVDPTSGYTAVCAVIQVGNIAGLRPLVPVLVSFLRVAQDIRSEANLPNNNLLRFDLQVWCPNFLRFALQVWCPSLTNYWLSLCVGVPPNFRYLNDKDDENSNVLSVIQHDLWSYDTNLGNAGSKQDRLRWFKSLFKTVFCPLNIFLCFVFVVRV